MEANREKWCVIFDCYSVSTRGRVKSLARDVPNHTGIIHKPERILKLQTDYKGYARVSLGKKKALAVHRLVAKVFLSDFTEDKQVHHINENKSDNRLENLKAMTLLEHQRLHNQKYPETKICEVCGQVFTPDKTKRKRAHVCSLECKLKLDKVHALKRQKTVNQYSINGEFIKTWDSARSIQNATGYLESNINKCCNGKIKSYKGFVWSYTM